MKVVRKSSVAAALTRLRTQRTHTLFAGYLYLQKRSAELGTQLDLRPDFLSYFKKFFLVKDHPLGSPYIKLFTERSPSSKNLWLNQNIAGSYAPSSLRPGQPFRKVIDIDDGRYSLPPDHAKRAFNHLLFSKPVSAPDLAVVLYRDFGILKENATASDLIEIFAYEFGYATQPGSRPNADFHLLFTVKSNAVKGEELFENI